MCVSAPRARERRLLLLPAPAEGGWRLPASRIVPNFALARVARALCVQSAAAAGWLGTKSHRRTAGARDQARSSGHVEALANVRDGEWAAPVGGAPSRRS